MNYYACFLFQAFCINMASSVGSGNITGISIVIIY
ncbi:alanine:cation symporter family protein [Peribacillus butanolivorans]